MAKEKSDKDKEERKREKKERKEKRSEKDGVHKSKKEKKVTEAALAENDNVATKLLNKLEEEKPGSVAIKENGGVEVKVKTAPILGALVPFANPLADEKVGKKVLKSVKKAAKNKSLKRGVKEVVKSLRKSTTPASSSNSDVPGVVILAADISPMDVISHIPVLCEDHGVPYIFVPSRAELGAAGNTKRPTSVVMVSAKSAWKKREGENEEGEEDFAEVYKDLVKVVERASRDVKI
ncbi:MAG: H ACA ribonucleo complex subunit 2 [Lasallia pustulata]|uniref:H/ACA ribonucleoprotein complex subunit 2 n=1 Tax=Lasallia pustulata TaxID=136370 RepID=A0A5M8PDA5_9LECA|nr:MAG: H ACA ribonucleo complex subunit 2 [Lasallia pustulata]